MILHTPEQWMRWPKQTQSIWVDKQLQAWPCLTFMRVFLCVTSLLCGDLFWVPLTYFMLWATTSRNSFTNIKWSSNGLWIHKFQYTYEPCPPLTKRIVTNESVDHAVHLPTINTTFANSSDCTVSHYAGGDQGGQEIMNLNYGTGR